MVKKVLIIDDEEDFCFFIKKNLEKTNNYKVTACSDSKSAIAVAKELKPDVILIDIMMPDKDGTEIARELKMIDETRDIPFLFLTALVTEDEIQKHKNIIKGEYFIAKPVKIEELIKVINSIKK